MYFSTHSRFLLDSRKKLIRFYIKPYFWHLKVLVCYCPASQLNKVSSIYNIGVQTEVRVLKVSETKITTEKAFNQDHFGIEGNHETDSDEKNPILGIFADSWLIL